MARLKPSVKSFVLWLCFLGSDGRPTNIEETVKDSRLITLITTSYVEKMPAFLEPHAEKLEMVNGNPCVTVEAVEERASAGNLMARRTCWCMTVIEVPISPTLSRAMISTALATPVYTTTVTVFASSVLEKVFETTMGPDFESTMTPSPLASGQIPESLISTSWQSNTIESSSSGETSFQSRSLSPTAAEESESFFSSPETTSLFSERFSSLERFSPSSEIFMPSSNDLESTSIETSFSTPSVSPSLLDENSYWQPTPTLSKRVFSQDLSSQPVGWFSPRSGEMNSEEFATESTPSLSSGSSWLNDESSSSVAAGTTVTPETSFDPSESMSNVERSSSDFQEQSAEVSSWTMATSDQLGLPPLSTSKFDSGESEISSDVIVSSSSTENILSLRLNLLTPSLYSDIPEESEEVFSTPSISEVPAIASSPFRPPESGWGLPSRSIYSSLKSSGGASFDRSASFVTRFPPWTLSKSTVRVEGGSYSQMQTLVETSRLASSTDSVSLSALDTVPMRTRFGISPTPTVMESLDLARSELFPTQEEASTAATADWISSSPTQYLPSISPGSAPPDLQERGSRPILKPSSVLPHSTVPDSTSRILHPTTASPTFPDVPPSLEGSLSDLDSASLLGFPTVSVTDSMKPSTVSTLSVTRSSKQLDSSELKDVMATGNRTQGIRSTTTIHKSLRNTRVTLVPSRTSIMLSSVRPPSPKPTSATPSDQDRRYWIQTELRLPRGINSTDTSKLVKNLAFLYERAYAAQARRPRRQSGRFTSIKLIYVRVDYKERNMTLVYVLFHQKRLVPAAEAVARIRVVPAADMEQLLDHGVIVKAKPYEPAGSSAPLKDNRFLYEAYVAWITVLVLLLLLLLLLAILLYLCIRNRKRQKAEVKDAEVSNSFSQGEGKFSTTSGVTMPGESIRSYRDAVTSPVHFRGIGTYRRSESPRFYENEAFDPDEPKLRKRPTLTRHTFETTFESQPQQAKNELTPPEDKPRQREFKNQQSSDLSKYQDTMIPAEHIEIRPVVSEVASEDETPGPSEEQIEEARRQLESMTERLNALVDNSLTVEQTKTKLHGSYRQKLLIGRKDYKRSRSADSIDKHPVPAVPSVSNPIFRDQPTQTSFAKKNTPPHFLVTIHKAAADRERKICQQRHKRSVEDFENTKRVTYREPTSRVIEAIRHELDLAQEFPKESFA